MDLPYGPDQLDRGAFQVWQYQPKQFAVENIVDLTNDLGADLVPSVLGALHTTPELVQFADGSLQLRGRLTYSGPGAVGNIILVDLSPYTAIFTRVSVANSSLAPIFVSLAGVAHTVGWGINIIQNTVNRDVITVTAEQDPTLSPASDWNAGTMVGFNVFFGPLPAGI